MAEINAVNNTDRFGGYKVAAYHADIGALHRGVGNSHREFCGKIQLDFSADPLDDLKGLIIGDPQMAVKFGTDIGFFKRLINLRFRTENQNQLDTQTLQNGNVGNNA